MNAYDQLAYTNRPNAQTHPAHLAVLARLHGLDAPPVERARVLEIGVSEGANLIPMAATLPHAEFVGIDLAATPVERGNQAIAGLGLDNIRLLRMDLLEMAASFGTFDYIIAHGLYGWTPPQVSDKLLAVARAHLSPQGVAFISYNAMPGGHLRRLVRQTMLFAAEPFEEPADRVIAARAMLDLIAAGVPEPDPIEQAIAYQAKTAMERSDSALFHDYLAPVFEPAYFRDFAAHAARHGLAYVADAGIADNYNLKLFPAALEAVRNAAGAGRIFQEQLLDLLRGRRFRRSIVCHAECEPSARWDPARAVGLYAASAAQETGDGEFTGPDQHRATPAPDAAAFLRGLMALYPRAQRLEQDHVELALELCRRGLIDLSTVAGMATPAGEKPMASLLVRRQAAQGDPTVSTLRHTTVEVSDDEGRRLLTLLDGTRDRDTLAREMQCSREQMDAQLELLGRLAVLSA
jgi:SAM-dependent methyltransferase